jgi:hypothetical protein
VKQEGEAHEETGEKPGEEAGQEFIFNPAL